MYDAFAFRELPGLPLQAKLSVSQPGDPFESEADEMAERVMRMPDPGLAANLVTASAESSTLARSCLECEKEDELQRKAAAPVRATTAPPIVEDVLRSSGRPLDETTLAFMEPRFDHDFSRVRVHADATAAESARAVGAHAYTVGTDVVFGRNEFAPSTVSGRKLIAHELAHVIQQSGATGHRPAARLAVQRVAEDEGAGRADEAAPASGGSSQVRDISRLKSGVDIDVTEGRVFANEALAKMAAYGAVVSAPPSDLVASSDGGGAGPAVAVADNEVGAPRDGQVQTSAFAPTVQRAGGGSVTPEAGFVGSIQICYDVCNGEVSVVGWVWAGGGVVTKGLFGGKAWWGAYVFAEKEFFKTKLAFMPTVNCGTCDTGCKPEEGAVNWGGGLGGFPVAIKPGERSSLKQAGIEVGLLLSARSTCDADLEVIALVDLTKYLGPVGAAVVAAEELANEFGKRFGIEIECGVGVDISGAVHLCKSVPGGGILGITSDSAKVCGGGYVGCGVGLAHDKSALPGI